MTYEHTQSGWPLRIGFALIALVVLVLGAVLPFDSWLARLPLLASAALAAAIAVIWTRMTVRLADGRLQWWFGPGWPRGSLAVAQIRAAEATRTTWLDGWGIHYTRRGWLYNIAGRDAVVVTRTDGKRLLLGTDEPRRLQAAIERAAARKAGV